MHKSRLSTLLIDCTPEDFERGNEFWSRALGKPVMRTDDERYTSLKGRVGGDGGLYVALQRVPPQERAYHVDIETDDVEREVARLSRLGAKVKARIHEHVVMVAPTGHPFCVVKVYRPDFTANAVSWTEEGDAQ
jgi:predicted enzyme related to lactoylglutathione lyase